MFENRATQIAGVLYLLFVILFIVAIALHTDYWKTLLLILLFSIPYVFISLYDIDCVFSGQCNIWAWVKGILFIVYIIFSIVVTILLLVDFQKTIDVVNLSKDTEDKKDTKDAKDVKDTKDKSDSSDYKVYAYYNLPSSSSNITYRRNSNLNAEYIDALNKQLYINRKSVYGY